MRLHRSQARPGFGAFSRFASRRGGLVIALTDLNRWRILTSLSAAVPLRGPVTQSILGTQQMPRV